MGFKKSDIKNIDKGKLKWLILVPVLLAALGVYMYAGDGSSDTVKVDRQPQSVEEEQLSADKEKDGQKEGAGEYIYVDVSGAVNSPMVVCIPEGSRVFEALDAAGGRSAESSVKNLNLAAVCEDGQKIYVPTEAEVKAGMEQGEGDRSQSGTSEHTDTSASSSESGGQGAAAGKDQAAGKVNINTAGSEDLQTLTGVGPAIASRIIDYRNKNGSFKSIDELTNVSGIGEKTLAKFRDEICV